jgi:integrase
MATRLTNAVVKTADGPDLIWDDTTKGLCLRVYKGGAKSFVFAYGIDGARNRITIGRWPTWSCEAARDRAKELQRLVDQGRDPAGEKRQRREAATVGDLIERYITEHLPTKRTKGRKLDYLQKSITYRETDEKRMLDEIVNRLGKYTKVADIHGGDIREMHRQITEARGPVRANRVLSACSKAFALSLVPMAGETLPWRDAAMGNPCKGVKRNHEEPKEHFFSQDELARISDALNAYGLEARGPGKESAKSAADCVRLIMLTGCRPGEAMLARWPEFDETGFWVKPSAHTKQGKVHKLPLNPGAVELIERLRKQRKPNATTWVFPGQRPGEPLKRLHIWPWLRQRAGLGAHARLYDLRHTFASVGAGGGLSLPIIGRLLGHTQARTTQRYAHLGDDPLREATEKIGAVIAGAGNGNGKSAEVLPIKGRRS